MRVAIMQPYFLPYLGYWQLIALVDRFVLYDDIQYTKKGWINRNRFLRNGQACQFTLPLRQGSEGIAIRQRSLAASYDRARLLRQWDGAYRKAPFYEEAMTVLRPIVEFDGENLYDYLDQSVRKMCIHLGITTEVIVSSTLATGPAQKGTERVLAICRALGADSYINPIGGVELYREADFSARQIALRFHALRDIRYDQGGVPWVPNLSIVDVLMFKGTEGTRDLLSARDVLEPAGARRVTRANAPVIG